MVEEKIFGSRSLSFSVNASLLVSTYVCEGLSVMHEPAGVVEILVQILVYPYSVESPPPRKLKFGQILVF